MKENKRTGLRCNKCKDEIISLSIHDYRECKCGACAIDGGMDYTRIIGNEEDWELIEIVRKGK